MGGQRTRTIQRSAPRPDTPVTGGHSDSFETADVLKTVAIGGAVAIALYDRNKRKLKRDTRSYDLRRSP